LKSEIANDLLKALALLAAALVCAGLANGLVRRERKLDWTGWAPPPAALQPVAPPPPQPAPKRAAAPGPAPMALPAPTPGPPAKAPKPPPANAATPGADAQFAPVPNAVIREISSSAAWDAFRLKIPFLDARRSEDFQAGHIAGAWSVPIWEASASSRIIEFEARANPAPQAPIGIYCSGGDCEDSRLLAKKLVDLGYRNLLIYRDGFPDWVKQGRPQERGARP
jgi:rhodanese-related sulfurtransferase